MPIITQHQVVTLRYGDRTEAVVVVGPTAATDGVAFIANLLEEKGMAVTLVQVQLLNDSMSSRP